MCGRALIALDSNSDDVRRPSGSSCETPPHAPSSAEAQKGGGQATSHIRPSRAAPSRLDRLLASPPTTFRGIKLLYRE